MISGENEKRAGMDRAKLNAAKNIHKPPAYAAIDCMLSWDISGGLIFQYSSAAFAGKARW
ncbi:uncharacterized protein METZ01_LOCUS222423 [marine metagenome]|uniref:Uncharacterized protein n=1 Tax=marine metagenome TaxID=408172 RepID=A0A382G3V5_9ZZZZ